MLTNRINQAFSVAEGTAGQQAQATLPSPGSTARWRLAKVVAGYDKNDAVGILTVVSPSLNSGNPIFKLRGTVFDLGMGIQGMQCGPGDQPVITLSAVAGAIANVNVIYFAEQ